MTQKWFNNVVFNGSMMSFSLVPDAVWDDGRVAGECWFNNVVFPLQVQYGTTADWPENVREQDFVINEPKQYPRARIKRDASKVVTYTLTNLPAYMSVTLHVRVLTKYYVGPPSNMLEFDTVEGGERSWGGRDV